MTDRTLTISLQGLTAREIGRIRAAVDLSMRDAEIRARYADLKRSMRRDPALQRLADDYYLSFRQVWRIVYGS